MSIFDRRVAFKPFEYPKIDEFKKAIQHSYWLVSEWNFTSDIQDFRTKLTPEEQNTIKNSLLAISQIEISVKRFWTTIGTRLPKAEFEQVGVVFGESEVRHADAYSHLLEVLGLNDDFSMLMQNPAIQGRVDYLTKYLKGAADNSDESFALILTLFSIFVENVSLFSQFLIIKSFNKYKNILKDVDNVVQATQKEEMIHALFGVEIIKIIRSEFPEWFNEDFHAKIVRACKRAYESEEKIIEWIFEKGDLDHLTIHEVKEFTKDRFNQSLELIGYDPVFNIDRKVTDKLQWFDEEILAETAFDFFHKKSVGYSKNQKSVTESDLF